MNEWDSENVIMCGGIDGVVNIYSCVVVDNDGSLQKPVLQKKASVLLQL